MIRTSRLSQYLVALIVFLFLSITTLSRYYGNDPAPKSNPEPTHFGTKYLSWLPHGDFTDQHEAFRNAVRLGKELNRTIIAPMLRLGKPIHWQPFDQLAHSYTVLQNKQQLRQNCHATSTITTIHDQAACLRGINEWTEIPWSSLFDLDAITNEFNIRIIERTYGHGWGWEETAQEVVDPITDVVVMDTMTFIENATFNSDRNMDNRWGDFLGRKISQYIVSQPGQDSINNGNIVKPYLKSVIHSYQWVSLRHRQYIQFGALSSTPRYQVHSTTEQKNLRKALSQHLFVRPDLMVPLQQQVEQAVKTLGGVENFDSLYLDLAKVIELDGRANSTANRKPTIDDLDVRNQRELMDMIVMELFGEVPIHQAVATALPVKSGSSLAILLSQQQTPLLDRQQLLNACIEYRQNFEEQYPIYYLVSNHIPPPSSRPDIYGPLLSHFPCLFTKADLKLDLTSWISAHHALQDQGVDYDRMLSPILNLLIAGKGSSFFEVPPSPLTKFVNRQRYTPADNSTLASPH